MDGDGNMGADPAVLLRAAITEAAAHAEAHGDRETVRQLLDILGGMAHPVGGEAVPGKSAKEVFFF